MSRGLSTLLLVAILFLINCSSIAQGAAGHFAVGDSSTCNSWYWITEHVGGDLFVSGELYGLHLRGPSSTGSGIGPGFEVRVRPVHLGSIIGVCGDEGIPGLHSFENGEGGTRTFTYTSIYAGVVIDNYRIEAGEISASNSMWVTHSPSSSYTVGFLGVSRRIGGVFFLEPEFTIMYPVASHYYNFDSESGQFTPVTQHYNIGDLFFGLSVKLGIGFN